MEFLCPYCPRRNVFQYKHYQHLHIEHRQYTCEVCKEDFPSRKKYRQHQMENHNLSEHDLIEEWWNIEREWEKKVEHECWVKSMLVDSASEIRKIATAMEGILSDVIGDVDGLIDECHSPIFHKLKSLVIKLEHEEKVLLYYVNIEGTVTKFADGVKVYPPPKYIPNLSPRPEWKKCPVDDTL